jgi:pimeloyl-ACP methyl ester carboxylesterase
MVRRRPTSAQLVSAIVNGVTQDANMGVGHELQHCELCRSGFTDMSQYAEDLERLLRPEEVREHLYSFWKKHIGTPVTLVGTSLGGTLAIDFSVEYPEVCAATALQPQPHARVAEEEEQHTVLHAGKQVQTDSVHAHILEWQLTRQSSLRLAGGGFSGADKLPGLH